MTVENLWEGYINELRKPAFLDFLHQQLVFFRELTKGKLVGSLEPYQADEKLRYDLDITAPVLDDYSFTLRSVLTGPTEYPLIVENALENREPSQCHNQEEFKQAIRAVISSYKASEAISSTLSLANEENHAVRNDEN